MTRRRISNRTPRELTAKERSALSDVVLELDSDFRVKTGSVDDVSQVLPESGVIVLNELDGRLYAADKYGWHRFGDPYVPISFFVDFNGVDQFVFRFLAPSTATLEIHDGDGTVTEVPGQDGAQVTHTTNYAAPGVYYFFIRDGIYDVTILNLSQQTMLRGSLNGMGLLPNLVNLSAPLEGIYGNTDFLIPVTGFTTLSIGFSQMIGDVSKLTVWTSMRYCYFSHTAVHGDVSKLIAAMTNIVTFAAINTKITVDGVEAWQNAGNINLSDCKLTSRMVDNALESCVALSGATINLGGNNAKRTSASGAAFAIVDANNTLTVNQ